MDAEEPSISGKSEWYHLLMLLIICMQCNEGLEESVCIFSVSTLFVVCTAQVYPSCRKKYISVECMGTFLTTNYYNVKT